MKKTKSLWRIAVVTSPEAEDAVAEFLGNQFGAASAAYFNLESRTSMVTVFQDAKPDPDKTKKAITTALKHIAACGLRIGAGQIEISRVKREDWAESWKRHFHPLEIGPTLLVKPSWSKRRPKKRQAVVILDPGLSFGTGQHPTTSFCLSQIAALSGRVEGGQSSVFSKAKSFLDIGTGSGILAIAAAKLGFVPVDAFDFDPESVRVAKGNARKNRVAANCKVFRGDITKLPLKPARRYDLVCANLISNLLIAERQRIVNRLKPGGTLVLAGILAEEFGVVQAAYEGLGLKLAARRGENEWCSGAFCFA